MEYNLTGSKNPINNNAIVVGLISPKTCGFNNKFIKFDLKHIEKLQLNGPTFITMSECIHDITDHPQNYFIKLAKWLNKTLDYHRIFRLKILIT